MARMSASPTYKSASMHVWQPERSKAKPASAGLFASVLHDASLGAAALAFIEPRDAAATTLSCVK